VLTEPGMKMPAHSVPRGIRIWHVMHTSVFNNLDPMPIEHTGPRPLPPQHGMKTIAQCATYPSRCICTAELLADPARRNESRINLQQTHTYTDPRLV
jgi:hypothetical protein